MAYKIERDESIFTSPSLYAYNPNITASTDANDTHHKMVDVSCKNIKRDHVRDHVRDYVLDHVRDRTHRRNRDIWSAF